MLTTRDRPTILGDEVPCNWAVIPTEIYARVLDAETKEPTGYIRRTRWRTRGEVFRDLENALDLWVCPKCKHEQPKEPKSCAWQQDCPACDERMESLIDEYFMLSGVRDEADLPCGPMIEIVCLASSGGNEGYHVSIGALVHQTDEQGHELRGKPPVYQHWYHYKTLMEGEAGMDRAFAFARRCAKLLGI